MPPTMLALALLIHGLVVANVAAAYAVIERPPSDRGSTSRSQFLRWRSMDASRAFEEPVFPPSTSADRTIIPCRSLNRKVASDSGVVLPDFDVLMSRMAAVSPLARQALEGKSGGFDALDGEDEPFRWKEQEMHKKKLIHQISKIDNFAGNPAPLLRLRSTLQGPHQSRGERFSQLVTDFDLRSRWDPNIAENYPLHEPSDMSVLDDAMMHRFGETRRFGIGYVRTKQTVVSPREQLTMCGVQDFPSSGASLVWGVEVEDDQNHLFPRGRGDLLRSRSHLFSAVLMPRDSGGGEEGPYGFDVEYCIQIEVGKFPAWLTGPVVAETLKGLFRFGSSYFEGGLGDGELARHLARERDATLNENTSILIPP